MELDTSFADVSGRDVIVNKKISTRKIWIDIVRIYAIINVILIHSASPILYTFNNTSTKKWLIANGFDSFARLSVPLFVMISGMLLLDDSKNESLRQFFTKRLNKILLPFAFWGIVYLLWKHYMHNSDFSFGYVVRSFLAGSVYDHFWFIYMIIALYLLTPIYRAYVKAASRENIIYMIMLWTITISIMPFIKEFFNVYVHLYIMVSYIGFFVLGYLLDKLCMTCRWYKIGGICLIIGFVGTFVGTYLKTNEKGEFYGYLYDYTSPNVILMSFGAIVLFMYLKKLDLKDNSLIKGLLIKVSDASFGVYFIHMLVLEILNMGLLGTRLNSFTFNPIISIPLLCGVTFIISLGIVLVLKKIPLVRRFV